MMDKYLAPNLMKHHETDMASKRGNFDEAIQRKGSFDSGI